MARSRPPKAAPLVVYFCGVTNSHDGYEPLIDVEFQPVGESVVYSLTVSQAHTLHHKLGEALAKATHPTLVRK